MSKKIGNIITTSVLIVLLLLVGIMYIPKLFGITPMVVLSGSMEPTYKVGALIFVKDVEPSSLKVEDNVTFYLNDTKTVVTHRIVELDKAKQTMITKGDNNNIEDGEQALSNAIGKAMDFSIPLLGYLATYISTPAGLITLACIVVACLLITHLLERKEKKPDQHKL